MQVKAAKEETTATETLIRELKSTSGLCSEKSETDHAPAEELKRTVANHTQQLSKLTQELLALRHRLKQI